MCSISSAAKVSVWSTGIMYEFWKSVHLSGMERETSEWTFKSMSQEADWKFRIIGSCCLFVSKWWREINEGRTQEAYGKHEVESPYQSKTLRKVAVNSCTKMNPKTLEYNNTEAGAGICLAHLKGRMWDSSPHPSLNQYKNKNKKTCTTNDTSSFQEHGLHVSPVWFCVSCEICAPREIKLQFPAVLMCVEGTISCPVLGSLFLLHGCTKDWW